MVNHSVEVLEILRWNQGKDMNDTSVDDRFDDLEPSMVLNEILEYEDVVRVIDADWIKKWVLELYKVDLNIVEDKLLNGEGI